jgi:F-box/leucine-rich repeat protein 10/11
MDGDINGHEVNTYNERGGGLDAFASIALSTGSSHNNQLPESSKRWKSYTQPSEAKEWFERPSKRAKSEKLPSPEVRRYTSRPTTSYAPPIPESRLSEAELIVHFSREACFAVPPSHSRHNSMSSGIKPSGQNGVNYPAGANDYTNSDTINYPPTETKLDFDQSDNSNTSGGRKTSNSQTIKDSIVKSNAVGDSAVDEPLTPFVSHVDRRLFSPHTEKNTEIEIDEIKGVGDATAGFLAGIEEAAAEPVAPKRLEKSGLNIPKDMTPASALKPSDSSISAASADSPSICAECNFVRNRLTAETENDATSWICCDSCKSWFHFACAGFKNEREVRAVDKYRCRKCKPIYGPTTYVRKSTRAHNAIDYAGLNEGVLKTSDDNPEHHYIQPIKDGQIKFNPEMFARMRPELVTTEFFERGDGWKEPIVIPAALNPRPQPIPDASISSDHNDSNDMDEDTDETEDVPPYDASVLEEWLGTEFEYEVVPDVGQDALGMVMPRDLTVRKVCELYGPEQPVEVIDVKSQNGEDKKWNMRRWTEYYESKGSKIVRNVISLEVSHTKLGRLIQRPKLVRDLDLQDAVWPAELLAKGDYPKVQFYCLMSVADCFTDFHIDFGGSSVFYHILKGRKTFFFIPPTERHLKKYEEWCNSRAQNWTFLGDQTKECYRVDLYEGDTALIPAGWIHAVWTPEDSLVIGGNFLTRMNYAMQIRVTQIEKATGVARKFRYPHFQKLQWYAAMKYLEEDPIPNSVEEKLLDGQPFTREEPVWLDYDNSTQRLPRGSDHYNARFYSKPELEGLPELARYLQRTALIASGNITDGISVETRNAVKKSIPKGIHGEPIEVVKKFALWYTWKEGNTTIPHWAYPDYTPEVNAPEVIQKKLSSAAMKRLDREAAIQAGKLAPERQSARAKAQAEAAAAKQAAEAIKQESVNASNGQTPGSAPRQPACESCRKRRRACKHRERPPEATQIRWVAEEDSRSQISDHSDPYNGSPYVDVRHFTPLQAEIAVVMANIHGSSSNSSTATPAQSYTPPKPLTIKQAPVPGSTTKSGRSKACQDCRRSKVGGKVPSVSTL